MPPHRQVSLVGIAQAGKAVARVAGNLPVEDWKVGHNENVFHGRVTFQMLDIVGKKGAYRFRYFAVAPPPIDAQGFWDIVFLPELNMVFHG